MSNIGTYTFTGWRGRLHAAVRRLAALPPRPGVNGTVWVIDGWETNPEPIVTSDWYAIPSDATADLNRFRALMNGSSVDVIDPVGQYWSVKVKSVTGEQSESPDGRTWLVCTWQLQVEAAP